jgi:tubby-related protein 1
MRSMTAYYCLSLDATTISRDSASYLGKLRASSVGGTGWQLFDNGLSPRDSEYEMTLRRRQLMAVHFQKNIMGSDDPARLACVVPSGGAWREGYYGANADGSAADAYGWRERSLVRRWLENEKEGLTLLVNKPPIWSDELGTYTLEYNGRATLASVKNMQLVPHDDPNNLVFQMGKVSDTRFNLDFKAPLSPVQAFAIALTVFDTKLAASAAPSTMRAAQRVKERVLSGVPSAIRAATRLSGRAASRRCSSGRESLDSQQSAEGNSSTRQGSPGPPMSPGEVSSPDSSMQTARKTGGARMGAAADFRPSLTSGFSGLSAASSSSLGLASSQTSSVALISTQDEPGNAGDD